MLKISEAAALTLHTASYLAAHPERLVGTHEIAQLFDVSETHLAKVLQRLVKARLIRSIRGPRGGFALVQAPHQVNLLTVYEAIEGPFDRAACLLGHPVCPIDACLMSDLVASINRQAYEYLNKTKLSHLAKDLSAQIARNKRQHRVHSSPKSFNTFNFKRGAKT